MHALDVELLSKTLSQCFIRSALPYYQSDKTSLTPILLHSKLSSSWVEFSDVRRGLIEATYVHRLFAEDELLDLEATREEIEQFNHLMERLMLPACAWENPKSHAVEFRWQEQFHTEVKTDMVQRSFEQSLFIATALHSRLARVGEWSTSVTLN